MSLQWHRLHRLRKIVLAVILSDAKNPSWIRTKRDSSRKIGAQNDTILNFPGTYSACLVLTLHIRKSKADS
jgi:hypothetical protein